MLDPSSSICDVSLWCDPDFLPTNSDRKGIACLTKNGFPLRELAESRDCPLVNILVPTPECEGPEKITAWMYSQGYEGTAIGSLRHYPILAVLADDYELDRNHATGKLRAHSARQASVPPLMCQAIDYHPGLLQGPNDATTNKCDVKRADAEETPGWERTALLARVTYRETLIELRRGFCEKGMTKEHQMHLPTGTIDCCGVPHPCLEEGTGCDICGRTYPRRKCSRCKQTVYCWREHQMLDWRYHKIECHTTRTSSGLGTAHFATFSMEGSVTRNFDGLDTSSRSWDCAGESLRPRGTIWNGPVSLYLPNCILHVTSFSTWNNLSATRLFARIIICRPDGHGFFGIRSSYERSLSINGIHVISSNNSFISLRVTDHRCRSGQSVFFPNESIPTDNRKNPNGHFLHLRRVPSTSNVASPIATNDLCS